ncbi:MAG: hypothetical protein Q8N39_02245 [Pelolinea sp.]|nr:hypothetical protein [Pelolinea sp.]
MSLTHFAQALAAIPIGFLAEKIGHKRSIILVNLVVGWLTCCVLLVPTAGLFWQAPSWLG